jgi:hypothetical protein
LRSSKNLYRSFQGLISMSVVISPKIHLQVGMGQHRPSRDETIIFERFMESILWYGLIQPALNDDRQLYKVSITARAALAGTARSSLLSSPC